jgi:hypothetical protein
MNTWWIVANNSPGKGKAAWHWDSFFREVQRAPHARFPWGGPQWVRSPASRTLIGRMRAGDLVVAYQSATGVVGFARLASAGYAGREGGHLDSFDISGRSAVRLPVPIPCRVIRSLPGAREDFGFLRFNRSSVCRVSKRGAHRLALLAGAFDPPVARQCLRYVFRRQR